MSNFFSYDGPFMTALGELATLIFINFFTILLCFPIITAGAAITTMHYCIMHMVDGDGHIIPMYFRELKNNLKSATPLWLTYVVILAFVGFDYWFVSKQTGTAASVLRIAVYVIIFVVLAVTVWLFPLTSRFYYSVKASYKNAAILAITQIPKTLIMMFFTVLIPGLLVLNLHLYPLIIAVGLSLPAYLCQFFYYPVIKKMIEDAQNRSAGESM